MYYANIRETIGFSRVSHGGFVYIVDILNSPAENLTFYFYLEVIIHIDIIVYLLVYSTCFVRKKS